ncbi:sulfotransferase [Waterburya agarophytonicola K14]|uniref:Sulfotransferase n=1 Tax=Waterburya agarophytonicola KI4 TaxID=2874699 RepID=A0A964BPF9_9CYAN|nr:sulfotransferase [Waterburya agarophytonicola]MCC0176452.1 sulfotransferase [Waterburya agarophytonicola KI4]
MTLIFIVGNSRSGTTMMSRIVGQHSQVFSFHELHFFGELWTAKKEQQAISKTESELLMAKLICIQRDGYLTQGDSQLYLTEAKQALQHFNPKNPTLSTLFKRFLQYEAQKNDKSIPCEHTPANVFYINEILNLYPEAKIINTVRDPRDVLLSQKRKWKRRFLGGEKIPLQEAIRSKINYHPITISKLWNSAILAGEKFAAHERVYSLNFEDLIQNPTAKVQEICNFLELSFSTELLEVPQIGSSIGSDRPLTTGIDASKTGNWRKGGLSKTEVFLCQQITQKHREKHNYDAMSIKPNYLAIAISLISLPVQLFLALLLNLERIGCYADTIKRRWA